ncbi:MAG: HAD-IIB family hydrolase [Saccharospirillum sp.]|nr:HAD-IIB family hydrolase [Saccharospirillum sp.]
MNHFAVLTDLDGTLLDHHNYDWHAAEPALQALVRQQIPVIAVTSKTAAEMPAILADIPYLSPLYSCENGAVLADARGAESHLEILGASMAQLIEVYGQVKQQHGFKCIAFHEVSAEQVADWTGLTPVQARAAQQRHATLPIYWPDITEAQQATFMEAAAKSGLQVLIGGRFLHLCGEADKGTAVTAIRNKLSTGVRIMALGDGGNDDAMLARADWGVRIPAATGLDRPEPVQGVSRASRPGPEGWNESVLSWLETLASPTGSGKRED